MTQKKVCAIIQAGGRGSRIRELTKDKIPKPMLNMNGKPMLQWQIEELKAYGITNIVIITGHLGEVIEEYFGDGKRYGVNISYIKEDKPLGSAGALVRLKEVPADISRYEMFAVIFGDVMFSFDWRRAFDFHIRHKSEITLFSHPNSHPYDSDLLIADKDCRVKAIISKKEKRENWHKNLVNAGIYIFSPYVIEVLTKRKPTADVALDMERDVILPAIEGGRVYAYKTTEYLKDTGTPERFTQVSKDLADGIINKRSLRNKQSCVFIDRDGTVNVHKGLISRPDEMELIGMSAEAIRRINDSGMLAILVTNQPVVARGMCSIDDVNEIHNKMETLLGKKGVYFDDIVFCPHHPDKGYPEENPKYKITCTCRKPKTGMIDEMVQRYNIDLSRSYIIGDSTVDIQTGINAGLKTILVKTGEGGHDGKYDVRADYTAWDILDAVGIILNEKEQEKGA